MEKIRALHSEIDRFEIRANVLNNDKIRALKADPSVDVSIFQKQINEILNYVDMLKIELEYIAR